MLKVLLRIWIPLVSLFIFVIGSSLFTTLIALKLHNNQINTLIIGAMSAAFYFGLMLGSFKVENFILKVGHIRAFATFSSSLSVIYMLHGIFIMPSIWVLLRAISGFATAGLFIVIESWLLSIGTIKTRGQILAFYMIVYYAAQILGQFLLNINQNNNLILFAIASMSASLAIIPLTMLRSHTPQIEEPSTLGLLKLYQASPTGIIGALCGGLLLGSIFGLLPVYLAKINNSNLFVSKNMAITILGGMLLQYPLGKLSDHIDRRIVLICLSVLTVICSTLLMLFHLPGVYMLIAIFMFGGFTFSIYPISISHTCDALDSKDILAGTQGLLLVYSVGACIGPLLAPIFMQLMPHGGLFAFYAILSAFLAFFFLVRWTTSTGINPINQEEFVSLPQTTPIVSELDPRGD